MINVLLILPDSTKNPFGGMGIQAQGLLGSMPVNLTFFEHNIGNNIIYTKDALFDQLIAQSVSLPDFELLKKINIIHSFDASTSLLGHGLSKMLKVPHIMSLHLSLDTLVDNYYSQFKQDTSSKIAVGIELSMMNIADAVIHVSHEYLRKYKVLNPNSFYQPNGIDFDKWHSTNTNNITLPGRQNCKKLCYIGRYAEMKNTSNILNAQYPADVDLYFIGEDRGGQDGYYEQMIDFVSKTPNAYYLGPKHGDEKISTLKMMDAVIVPSTHEPFGIVCLEALASGCTLLSSFESGMKEYLTEDIAVNCGVTAESITQAVQRWISLTPEEVEIRKHNGYELCKRYSWTNSVSILEEIYTFVLTNYK
jgi:glycosyltransferase involved in cell wall biosynthesis